mgnify:FL=1
MEGSIAFFAQYDRNHNRTSWTLTETDAHSQEVSPRNCSPSESDKENQYYEWGLALTANHL